MSNLSVITDIAILARKQRELLQQFEAIHVDEIGHTTVEAIVYRDINIISNVLHSIDSIVTFLLEEHNGRKEQDG